MNGEVVVSAGVLAMITLEILKRLVRKFYVKNPEYDFPPIFYETLIPFLSAVWSIALNYVGLGDPVQYTWMYIVQWLISCIVTVGAYLLGVQSMNKYAYAYKMKHL